MAWLAKDIWGREFIFDKHPYYSIGHWHHPNGLSGSTIKLPSGSINKLIGRELTYKDEPVELKED